MTIDWASFTPWSTPASGLLSAQPKDDVWRRVAFVLGIVLSPRSLAATLAFSA